MTDNEIKKALEECIELRFDDTEYETVRLDILKNALDLINQLETKNSNLTSDLTSLQNDLTSLKDETAEMLSTLDYRAEKILELVDKLKIAQTVNERLSRITRNLVGEIKAEAMTEFAERLKEYSISTFTWKGIVMVEDIDELLKEMVGEDNGEKEKS